MTFQRPCLDCGLLTTSGDRCDKHRKEAAARWKAKRGPSPYLDPAWRRLSAKARKEQPWCTLCGATEDLTADHIVPLSKGGALLVPTHALRILCRRCHGKVTQHKRGTR